MFSGRPRGAFTSGKSPVELPFRSDQLWNVAVHGRGVQFSTLAGKSGAKNSPFVFTCESEEAAAALAALLPSTKDSAFLAHEQFAAQLGALPDAGRGLTSVTNLVILANIVVFVLMALRGAGWFEVTSMQPYFAYANNAAATTDGQWWRLLTCMFLHYGIIHLLLNLWALFQAGHIVERLFGRPLYTLIYFGSGIISGLATLLWNGDQKWSAGASGAVFGVYGALIGYLLREKHAVPAGVFRPMLQSTLVFAGYNLFYGAVHPNIDNAAHLGGLLSGAVLGWLCALPLAREARIRLRPRRAVAGLLGAGVLITAGVIAAPRYDYRVSDELAWQETNQRVLKAQPDLRAHEQAAFAAYQRDPRSPELARWLTSEGIPFYENWQRQLDALPLVPGRLTARRRVRVDRMLQLILDSNRRLARDLAAQAPDALARFEEAQKAVAAAQNDVVNGK